MRMFHVIRGATLLILGLKVMVKVGKFEFVAGGGGYLWLLGLSLDEI